ncbi:MAG: hypothetical protein F6J87_10690 [Spirulina sp. SIO3F2]|nr:hypothetical protein [Spirulina sp. SIO3F2]
MNEESIQQKLKSLREIDVQDETGLKTAIAALDDSVLEVRLQAYWLLKDSEDRRARKAIFYGLKMNPGDTIHCVYKSAISYGDDWYYLHNDYSHFNGLILDGFTEDGEQRIDNEDYLKWLDWQDTIPEFTLACLNLDTADEFAHQLHEEIAMSPGPVEINLIANDWSVWDKLDLKQWCIQHGVDFENFKIEAQHRKEKSSTQSDELFYLSPTFEEYLIKNGLRKEVGQLWQDLHGGLAFVHTVTFNKEVNLKISDTSYQSSRGSGIDDIPFLINSQRDFHVNILPSHQNIFFESSDEKINTDRLSFEEEIINEQVQFLQEINPQDEEGFWKLITALDNSVLKVRAQAYLVLSDWERESFRKYITLTSEELEEWENKRIEHDLEEFRSRNDFDMILFDITNDPEVKLFELVEYYINRGVRLDPGETVYCVYASGLSYDDNFYSLHDELDLTHLFPDNYDDPDDQYYNPSFQYACLDLEMAEYAARQLHNQTAFKLHSEEHGMMIQMIDWSASGLPESFSLYQWCAEHHLPLQNIAGESDYGYSGAHWQDWKRVMLIERYLHDNQHDELLGQLWLELIGKLAFIHKVTLKKTRYLPIVEVF